MTKIPLLFTALLVFLVSISVANAAVLPPSFDDYREAKLAAEQPAEKMHGSAPVGANPLPPTFAEYAAQKQNALTAKTLPVELKTVLARNLPVAKADMREWPAEYRADWKALQTQLSQLDEKQKNITDNKLDDRKSTTELQQILRETHKKAWALREKMRTPHTPASVDSAAETAADADSNTEIAQIEALARELAYREELINKLLENSHGSAAATTTFSASLLAIQNYPVASGGLAIFALAVLWLLRGRLAELSAFGLKMRFSHEKKAGTKPPNRVK